MQNLGLITRNRWFPLIASSLAFGLLHGANPEIEKFGNSLNNVLPYYMHPKRINFITDFPLTTSGKTDIKQLQELL